MKVNRLFAVALFWFAMSIILGAFAAHALKGKLDEKSMSWWLTAVEYHRSNALGIGLYACWFQYQQTQQNESMQQNERMPVHLNRMAWLFHVGLLCFSGSLYVMALGGPKYLGAITPIGGSAWIFAWLYGAYLVFRS